jgi:hypothetical protein
MTKHSIFIQVQDRPGIIEAEVSETATVGELRKAVEATGVTLDADISMFIDEAEEPLHSDHGQAVPGLKRGVRVHLSHCKRITANGRAPVCARHSRACGEGLGGSRVQAESQGRCGARPADLQVDETPGGGHAAA